MTLVKRGENKCATTCAIFGVHDLLERFTTNAPPHACSPLASLPLPFFSLLSLPISSLSFPSHPSPPSRPSPVCDLKRPTQSTTAILTSLGRTKDQTSEEKESTSFSAMSSFFYVRTAFGNLRPVSCLVENTITAKSCTNTTSPALHPTP